ncbi:MAG TPA: glycosyltransferase family 39 protein [Elusimicrobiota bacterium]|nr:glycosyltransferase family 39 protein [Elusimicrobiota bacterium]
MFSSVKKASDLILKHDALVIALFLSILFLQSLRHIDLPGLNADEAIVGMGSGYILNIFRPPQSHWGERLGGRFFPVMENQYTSALPSYLVSPFFKFLGADLISIRLMSILLSMITLVYVYRLCKTLFGPMTAMTVVLLAGTHPAFAIFHKMASTVSEVYLACFFWAAAFHLTLAYERRSRLHLCAGAFFVGLGLNKITFLWYIAAFVAMAFLFGKRFPRRPELPVRDMIPAVLAFALGSSLMLYFNLRSHGTTLRLLVQNLFSLTPNGFNNLDYPSNLLLRLGHFISGILQGTDIGMGTFYRLKGPFRLFHSFFALSFAAGLASLFYLKVVRKSLADGGERVLFWTGMMVFILLCSPFTVSELYCHHLYTVFPIPQMIVAFFLCKVIGGSGTRYWRVGTAALICAALLGSQLHLSGYYARQLRETGGLNPYSRHVAQLADYLDQHSRRAPVIVDSIKYSLVFLRRGRGRRMIDRTELQPDQFKEKLAELVLKAEEFYFVVNYPSDEGYHYRREFKDLLERARAAKRHIEIVKNIYSDNDDLVFEVYRFS